MTVARIDDWTLLRALARYTAAKLATPRLTLATGCARHTQGVGTCPYETLLTRALAAQLGARVTVTLAETTVVVDPRGHRWEIVGPELDRLNRALHAAAPDQPITAALLARALLAALELIAVEEVVR